MKTLAKANYASSSEQTLQLGEKRNKMYKPLHNIKIIKNTFRDVHWFGFSKTGWWYSLTKEIYQNLGTHKLLLQMIYYWSWDH